MCPQSLLASGMECKAGLGQADCPCFFWTLLQAVLLASSWLQYSVSFSRECDGYLYELCVCCRCTSSYLEQCLSEVELGYSISKITGLPYLPRDSHRSALDSQIECSGCRASRKNVGVKMTAGQSGREVTKCVVVIAAQLRQ